MWGCLVGVLVVGCEVCLFFLLLLLLFGFFFGYFFCLGLVFSLEVVGVVVVFVFIGGLGCLGV